MDDSSTTIDDDERKISKPQTTTTTTRTTTMMTKASLVAVAMNRITGITLTRHLLLLPLFIFFLTLACSKEVEIGVDGTAVVTEDETTSSDGAAEQPPVAQQQILTYGVDVSWPMHHHLDIEEEEEETTGSANMNDNNNFKNPIRPDLADIYAKYMSGCYERYNWEVCEAHEEERLALNRNQPPLMKNFTSAGYAKVKAPSKAFTLLSNYFQKYNNKKATADDDEEKQENGSSSSSLLIPEEWPKGNVYTNHWNVNTEMNHLDMYMSSHDKDIITKQVKNILEKWCGVPLIETSMYGIRIYKRGSILTPHVDRLPLVISAIINVDQGSNVNEEAWPLEVIGHDGVAVNITMEPGDMILYESHSVIHGRPFPLQADYYANVFLHFEPIGYTYEITQQQLQQNSRSNGGQHYPIDIAKELYEASLAKHQEAASHSNNNDDDDDSIPSLPSATTTTTTKKSSPSMTAAAPSLQTPPYITSADETVRWRQEFVYYRDERKEKKRSPTKTIGATSAHVAAAAGDLVTLKEEAARNPDVINQADENGWKPIHEAARGGRYRVIQWLIEQGVDINERTHNGQGGTPLWWAEQLFPAQHLAIQILKKNGAKSLPPQQHEK